MNDILYVRDFLAYRNATEDQKAAMNLNVRNGHFDLSRIPSLKMRCEIAGFITYRGKTKGLRTFGQDDRLAVEKIGRFLSGQKGVESFRDKTPEEWIKELKKWMLDNGIPLTKREWSLSRREYVGKSKVIIYFEQFLKYLEPEDMRPEKEKDIWELERLDIPYHNNLINNFYKLDFTGITQKGIREETKRAVYYLIQYEKIATLKRKIGAMSRLSKFLEEQYPQIKFCSDIKREVFEAYLIYLHTGQDKIKTLSGELRTIKSLLELIGKIFDCPHLGGLVLQREIPSVHKPAFKAYSDAELMRLNTAIVELDEQIARVMVIHQMLGTRISDTLTLERGCLYQKGDEVIIRIKQMKTRPYEKPISGELAQLIRKAESYTEKRYGETTYIFVDDRDVNRPMQYNTVKQKIKRMIYKNDLRDDQGEIFGFGSHMFRRTYGMKLTELYADDWTIAKLLGHSGVNHVRHYRQMSNQVLAKETREIRDLMSEIIMSSLNGWEDDYEQVRSHD